MGEAGLVVIGNGPAGTAAALAFRERVSGTSVTLVTGEGWPCYSRPRLPEVISGAVQPEAIRLHPDEWYASRNMKSVLCQDAVKLDLDGRRVQLRDGRILEYGKLILAMGAAPFMPSIQGLPAEHVYVLRTLDDALNIRRRAQGRQKAALVGGGLLGLEAGYALTRLGLGVAVVEAAPWLLPRQVDEEGSKLLQEKLIPLGFEFYLGSKTTALAVQNEKVSLVLDSPTALNVDLVLLSAGIRPRLELARGTELRVNQGILVDDRMQTHEPDVYAAGDVAEWRGVVAGLWSASQTMGRVAGTNAAGGQAVYPGPVLSTTLKVAGVELCSQGEIHSRDSRVLVRRDADSGYWAKLFLRGDRVIGSIQIGRTSGAASLKRLMEQNVPVGGFEERLLGDGFDFNQIPGFKG